ncbi:bacterioferritin [Nitrospira sp. Kam-Ns4a]
MKAKTGIIDFLNKVVTLELTALHHYLLHASLCGHWGYERLRHELHELCREEMGHVSGVIDHLLYLEGAPDVQTLNPIVAGATVPDLLTAGLKLEQEDLTLLRDAIAHAAEVGDYTTRHKLEDMVVDTETHLDWFETQLRTIAQVGLDNYLSEQIQKGA